MPLPFSYRRYPVTDLLVLLDRAVSPVGVRELDPNDASSEALTNAIQSRPMDLCGVKVYHEYVDTGLLLPHERREKITVDIFAIDRTVGLTQEELDQIRAFLDHVAQRPGRSMLASLLARAGPARQTILVVPIICELIVYGCIVVAVRFGVSALMASVRCARAVRSRSRFRRGHCPKCTYDLAEVPADSYGVRCPECGSQWPALPDYGTLG